MDEPLLFSSHRLKELVKQLYMQIASDRSSIFEQPLIVISHPVVKEWIQLECTRLSENQALLGWEFSGWQRALSLLTGSLPVPTKTDLQAALWDLSKTSPPKEWTPFLGSERKRYDLVEQCASLFSDYSLYGLPQQSSENWQIEVFQKIFRKYSWQMLADALDSAAIWRNGPVYLFGLDWIPPVVYRFFQRHPRIQTRAHYQSIPSLKVSRRLAKRSLWHFSQRSR